MKKIFFLFPFWRRLTERTLAEKEVCLLAVWGWVVCAGRCALCGYVRLPGIDHVVELDS